MADLEVLRITVEAQTRDAEGALKRLVGVLGEEERAHRGAARGAQDHSEGLKKSTSTYAEFKKALRSTATELASIKQLLGSAYRAFETVFDVVEDAARTQAARKYFEDAGKSIERLREASKGMVSDAGLMKKANLADQMGIGNDTFEQLITVAQAASAKTGQSFDYMFDSIVTGTARSSRLLLDNLGIIVNVKEANIAYAKEIQKQYGLAHMSIDAIVKSMSAEAKQRAFINALSKEAAKNTEKFKEIGGGAAETFDKWRAAVENLKTAIGTGLISSLSTVLGLLTKVADKITEATQKKQMGRSLMDRFGVRPEGGLAGAIFGEDRARMNIPGLGGFSAPDHGGNQAAANKIWEEMFLADQVQKAFKAKFTELQMELADGGAAVNKFSEFLEAGSSDLNQWGRDLIADGRGFGERTQTLVKELAAANHALGLFKGEVKETALGLDETLDPDALADAQKKAEAEAKRAREQAAEDERKYWAKRAEMAKESIDFLKGLEEKRLNSLIDKARAEQQMVDALTNALGEFGKKLGTLPGNVQTSSGAILSFTPVDEKAALRAQIRAEEAAARDAAGASAINQASGLVSGDNAAFVQVLGSAIGTLFGAPQIGAAIGSLVGPFTEDLAGLSAVVQGLFNGFGKLVELVLGPVFDTLAPLGDAFFVLLTAVGILVRGALRPLLPWLEVIVSHGLVPFLAMISFVIVVLTPFVELIMALVGAFGIWLYLVGDLLNVIPHFDAITYSIEQFSNAVIDTAIAFHNAVYEVIRSLPGMEDFGGDDYKLSRADFNVQTGDITTPEGWGVYDMSDNEQREAIDENTEALRDLARELHNLPAGYRGAAAIWAASELENRSPNPTRRDPGEGAPNRAGRTRLSKPFQDPRPFNPYR